MARWKTLLLAGAMGCWPALASAQGPTTDLGVPALPPGAGSSVGTAPASSMMSSGRVSVSDRVSRMGGVPDISGMPNPEMVQPASFGGWNQNPFCQTVGGPGFMPAAPVCQEPCGTTIQASGPCGFLAFGEIMWYHIRRNDPVTQFSHTITDDAGNSTTNNFQSNFSTGNGIAFRVGGGYLFHNGWYGTVSYTHYKDTVDSRQIDHTNPFDPAATEALFYIGPGPLGSGAGGDATGGILDYAFHFKYDMVDVMGNTVISPASCLDLHIGAGFRVGNIDQRYSANIFLPNAGDAGVNANQDVFSRIRAVGPRVGTEARWYAFSPVTLYAKAYTSLLYSYRKESATLVNTDGITVNNTFASYNREDLIPMLELNVGGDLSLFNNRLLIGAGYEMNYLFGVGSTFTEQATNPRSARQVNLAIDGLNVHLTVLF